MAVAVLSYNHPEITSKCIESALKFDYPIYVIHNGSEKRWIKQLQEKFPQCQHLILEQNKGYSGGVNFGLSQLYKNFEWVILLTNDSEIQNLPRIPKHPSFVAPQILIKKTKLRDSLGGAFYPEIARIYHCKSVQEFQSTAKRYIPGTAFLLHREVFESAGHFDESLDTFWEDVDFSQRVEALNYRLTVDDKWLVEHTRGKTTRKYRHYTLYLFQRNRKIVSKRYCPEHLKALLYIRLMISWSETFLSLVARGRFQDIKLLYQAITYKEPKEVDEIF